MEADPKLTSSSLVATSETGSHVLKIDGYSRTKGIPTGGSLRSASFLAGGHRWSLRYYPNGTDPEQGDWISFFLVLDDHPPAPVFARFTIGLLDHAGKPVSAGDFEDEISEFDARGSMWGFSKFIKREVLESPRRRYLKDDCFSVRCNVTVFRGVRTLGEAAASASRVPPCDCLAHFRDLLLSGQGADVHFRVDGKEFAAHKCVLAARSPVFKAELLGEMEGANPVVVDGIRPDVFMSLLHFIYSDSLPEITEQKPDRKEQALMAQELLVAAERYGMKRLKIFCEDNLCRLVDAGNVAATLALAEEHGCSGLKMACFQFLKTRDDVRGAVMASGGFDHLASDHPGVFQEILSMFTAR